MLHPAPHTHRYALIALLIRIKQNVLLSLVFCAINNPRVIPRDVTEAFSVVGIYWKIRSVTFLNLDFGMDLLLVTHVGAISRTTIVWS